MNSFDEMSRLFREMDRTFDQFRAAWLHEFTTPGRGLESDRPTSETDHAALESDGTPETGVDASGAAFRTRWPAFGTTGSGAWTGTGTATGEPAATLEHEDDAYVYVMDLPGFEKSDINLGYDDDALTIDAHSDVEEGSDAVRSIRSRRVSRRVPIPTAIAEDEIAATYRNGVLEVRLPIAEDDDGGHRIEIE